MGGFTVCGLMVAPLLALVMQAFEPGETRFGQMFATVLPSYIANTFWLMLGVSVGSLLLAVPAAWLVARCEFRGRRLFQWALLLPLAMPAILSLMCIPIYWIMPGLCSGFYAQVLVGNR